MGKVNKHNGCLFMREVAALLGISYLTLYRATVSGTCPIPFFKTPGGRRRFRKADVEKYLKKEGRNANA